MPPESSSTHTQITHLCLERNSWIGCFYIKHTRLLAGSPQMCVFVPNKRVLLAQNWAKQKPFKHTQGTHRLLAIWWVGSNAIDLLCCTRRKASCLGRTIYAESVGSRFYGLSCLSGGGAFHDDKRPTVNTAHSLQLYTLNNNAPLPWRKWAHSEMQT